jgi:hypothetical protein
MHKLALFALFVFIVISAATSSAMEDEAIEVNIEGRYLMPDSVSVELAKEMAFYIARKKAVDLAGRYLLHKRLIESYELKRDEIYSLATNEIATEIMEQKRLREGKAWTYVVRIRARVQASDFVKASMEDSKENEKEARASYHEEMEQPVPADINPGKDISHAYRLLRKREWRMALIYLNHLDKKYPNWAEIHMAKALLYYIHHKPASMKNALGEACRLGNQTACDDLANIKKVHEYDFGISIPD